MTILDNPQVALWRGSFGDDYVLRNAPNDAEIKKLLPLWIEIFGRIAPQPVKSILEVGPNVGLNLRALRQMSDARFFAVEPNDLAREVLLRDGVLDAGDLRAGTAANIDFPNGVADLAFTNGVLIHINPEALFTSCQELHRCARTWIACIEYFSHQPETIPYRGHANALFKRDFGSFWLDNFPDLNAVAYGFCWQRMTGLDNPHWWLFRKS